MLQGIKGLVELKYGKKITYQKDCTSLSYSILETAGLFISPSTLRRLFGFLSTNSNPSRASLDTLSQYCGFADWSDFITKNGNEKPTGNGILDFWQAAQAKAHTLSKKYCETIKKQVPINFSNTVIRAFAEERLTYFLKSEYVATPFVGPGGYGKSTLLAGWVTKYMAQTGNHNDIILFIPAATLENTAHTLPFFDSWLLALLGIDSCHNFFECIGESLYAPIGKFILVIDALDELTDVGTKSNKIFTGLHQFIKQVSSEEQRIKVIVSSRYATWRHFFNESASHEDWYFADETYFTSSDANMPPFNDREIQLVLDNTINRGSTTRVVVEELTSSILQIISYPYYTQLFIQFFNPETTHLIGDRLDLLNEFVSKELHRSQYSEEKMDILNKIVELSTSNGTPGVILKNTLKEIYPIHLKLAGNYFQAYNQMLSYGIIGEENVENRFGSISIQIKILQWPVFELILLQKLIQQNKGLDFSLFKKIEEDFSNSPLMPNLICLLFEMAYKNKNIEALEKFFTLSDQTLQLTLSQPTIPSTLQGDDYMRNALIPHYAKDRKARQFLFQEVVNINSISTSWRFLIYNYLQNSYNEQDIFFANTMLCISGLLRLERSWIDKFSDFFPHDIPNHRVNPYIQGIWFSCKIICQYFSKSVLINDTISRSEKYSKEQLSTWGKKGYYQYYYGLTIGLIVAQKYHSLFTLLNRFSNPAPKGSLNSVEKALILFYEYSKWLEKPEYDPETMLELQTYMSEMPQWNSYIPLIVGNSWHAMYSLSLGKVERAYELIQKCIEISNLAGYLVFEVRMLKTLNSLLLSLGEPKKAHDCEDFAKGLVNKTGIDFDLL